MTRPVLASVSEAAEKATERPWRAQVGCLPPFPVAELPSEGEQWRVVVDTARRQVAEADAAYIVAACNGFPAMAEALRVATDALDAARAELAAAAAELVRLDDDPVIERAECAVSDTDHALARVRDLIDFDEGEP